MWNLLEKYLPLRAPEGGGGGGGDGTGGGGWTAPAGLPDEFKGASADETLGKLLGGFNDVNTRFGGLRDKLATMPKAPEKPDGYVYEPSDKLKPYFGDLKANPVFDQARQAFHKHGIPAQAFAGVIEDLYGPLAEKGLLGEVFDPKAELKTFASELGLDAAGATKALTETDAFAKGLFTQLKDIPEKLKPKVEAALLGLTDTAEGNVLLRALSGRLAENGIRIGGDGNAAGALTVEDLKKLDNDPRIDPANRNHTDPAKRFDEDLRKKYDEAYQRLAPANKTAW
ncbi:hypothetical protein LB572_03015 [Mesorhizobium sp. BH1-1-5]|uniref:hypothetical protein n=1 Tax=Mesorhizobium sp. BH1-1-5 TaxID=2876661 RepID=UPI001CCD940F|nr:hypothetical protein [Mesorhizobium sp. BH1-1-5]MBZ9986063.1 hypothetical protein [Mesorhizobium sp. BH1-1-5]